ncbi:hypothetical protein FS749_004657 [Ceratobasidium sp. UAMH 11750]|nr:hypothetical protein FS749_004657 [Ceratobasidium sp. UAMH 11750]
MSTQAGVPPHNPPGDAADNTPVTETVQPSSAQPSTCQVTASEIDELKSEEKENTLASNEPEDDPYPYTVNDFPRAFEGISDAQHELNCAMEVYYRISHGLPPTPQKPANALEKGNGVEKSEF